MDDLDNAINGAIESLTGQPITAAAVDPERTPDASARAWAKLLGHVRQNPMRHDARQHLLASLSDHEATEMPPALAAGVLAALNTYTAAIPDVDTEPVQLPALSESTEQTLKIVAALDVAHTAPFTLVGGQMVFLHTVEHQYQWARTTNDADLAVNVYSHRSALHQITGLLLTDHHLQDISPAHRDQSWSYKYGRDDIEIDVLAPEGVADKLTNRPPRTATGGAPVEMAGMQSAIKRTERLPVQFPDGSTGHLRRPDLLGAVAVKSAAAIRDSAPARHLEDLAILCDLIAGSPHLGRYRDEITTSQRQRLSRVADNITWATAQDSRRAQAALAVLLD